MDSYKALINGMLEDIEDVAKLRYIYLIVKDIVAEQEVDNGQS